MLVFFFFQAEDGIRDKLVTGVQTCALPIFLQFSSFNFDASFEQILPALITGATLIVRDNEVWNTREFADKLRDLQLTVADIPTAYWHQLATEWSATPEAVPPNALRLVIVGGEALSPEKLSLWHRTPLGNIR